MHVSVVFSNLMYNILKVVLALTIIQTLINIHDGITIPEFEDYYLLGCVVM